MDGSRIALVIANDQYSDPGLRALVAPAQDAAALAEVLADPSVGGFDVDVLRNESAQTIRVAVEDFFADRAPEDLLVLHFSCHGLKNAAGELYLAVADTRPTRLASTAVAADFVNRQMADSRAQRIALFLDCCYGGAFPRGMVVRAAGEAQVRDAFAGQEQLGGGRGRVVVTASSAMEYSFEGGQLATDSTPSPSVFTSAVVDGLSTGDADRDGDGWVGLTELVGFVTDRVHRVTPHQNPQMWTFGAQGELLIARSRVRRIVPTPLAPELLEALDSLLPATRFGAVDYLRERLHEADLGQAYAAWQALQDMVDDDSRKISEAARRALASASPRAIPGEVDLSGESVEITLEGPPIALTAVATASEPWIRVEQDGAVVRLSAEPGAADAEGSLVIAGPTGECVVPVRLSSAVQAPQVLRPAAQPVAAKPKQTPPPRTAAATPPAAARPAPEPTPPAAVPSAVAGTPPPPVGLVPWWLIGFLAIGAGLLIAVNWPGAENSTKLWYDPDTTGWYLYRSWTDPVMLSAIGALVASLIVRGAGRSAPAALGIVGGCTIALLESSLLILGADITADQPQKWAATAVIAAAMTAVTISQVRPAGWPLLPVPPLGAVLVVAGGILVTVSAAVKHPDGIAFFDVTGLAVLEPIVLAGLGWMALAATDPRARMWLAAATTTYAAVGTIGALGAWTEGSSPPAFLTALAGYVLVVAAVFSRGLRLPSRP